jgi:hypothetical protein
VPYSEINNKLMGGYELKLNLAQIVFSTIGYNEFSNVFKERPLLFDKVSPIQRARILIKDEIGRETHIYDIR